MTPAKANLVANPTFERRFGGKLWILSVLAALILGAACSLAHGDAVRLASIDARPDRSNANLVPNGGFESLDSSGFAKGWSWGSRWKAEASCVVDDTTAVGGRRSLKITNASPLESPYTGLLSLAHPVKVEPDRVYTLSAWVKSDDPGAASIVGGAGWRYRITLPATGGKWVPVSTTFTTDKADGDFGIFVQSESPTRGLWIDDIKLEEGAAATYSDLPPQTAAARLWPQSHDMEVLTEGDFAAPFLLCTRKAVLLHNRGRHIGLRGAPRAKHRTQARNDADRGHRLIV